MAMAASNHTAISCLAGNPPDFFSTPLAPLRAELSIPFQWEEAPGKPKPCTDVAPYRPPPLLHPPPGLLSKSEPCLDRSLSAKTLPSPRTPRLQDSPVAAKMKGFWHRVVSRNKKDDAPWSPTSTLFGPEAVSKRGLFPSLSSVSSASAPDLSLPFSPKSSSEAYGGLGTGSLTELDEDSDTEASVSSLPAFRPRSSRPLRFRRGEKAGRVHLSKRASESMRHVIKICKAGLKWRAQQRIRFSETEMWEPTLATYFHSMEIGEEARKKPLAIMEKELEDQTEEVAEACSFEANA